jgi:hypothetical protein
MMKVVVLWSIWAGEVDTRSRVGRCGTYALGEEQSAPENWNEGND